MTPKIFLSGPVFGLPEAKWRFWRMQARQTLNRKGIQVMDPMRDLSPNTPTSDPRFWYRRNLLELEECDALLVGTPSGSISTDPENSVIQLRNKEEPASQPPEFCPSFGTAFEIGWAAAYEKPIFCMQKAEFITQHALAPLVCMPPSGSYQEAAEQILAYFSRAGLEED